MHRAIKIFLASVIFTFLSVVSPSAVRADPIQITFTDPVQTLMVGFSGTFSGSLTNTSASPVTIHGSLLTFTVLGPVPDTLVVFFSAPGNPLIGGPLTLAPGESTGVVPLFRFDLIHTFSGPLPVTINGTFIVSFGDPFIPANQLGRANLTIEALPNPNPIPEPTTALLLATGLAGVATKVYRKRRRRAP